MRAKLKSNIGGEQLLLITPSSDWKPAPRLPDLRNCERIAVDLETHDISLSEGRGPGWATGEGDICGISIAWKDNQLHSHYYPLMHPDTDCLHPEIMGRWLKDHQYAGVQFTFHNGNYDAGWIDRKWGLAPIYKIDDTACMAYMVDENRFRYDLNSLCKWREVPGKDETMLQDAAAWYGYNPKSEMWRLPARYVGYYAEQDARSTLLLAESLEKDLESVKEAYRLEMDLLPMVHAMRKRGIRVDIDAANKAYIKFKNLCKFALGDIAEALGTKVGIEEIRSVKWLEETFYNNDIAFPLTVKTGRGSFEAKWMKEHKHWLPKKIVEARQYENAAEKFIKAFILDFQHKGRIHASIHQYRSENLHNEEKYGGGTRTYRFSYSEPALQQIPHRNEELAKDIRNCFIPEKGEEWLSADFSQQEYRLIVHYAACLGLPKAEAAAERYRKDPNTDFHQMVADMTGLERKPAKDANFAKAYGAGSKKFAIMTKKTIEEAEKIMRQYDENMPFVKMLFDTCERKAKNHGYIKLLDGALCRFNSLWTIPFDRNADGTPRFAHCSREEAERRVADPTHSWFGKLLVRSGCNKAMNSLIQGGAARQTKLAMRACWHAGYLPLLQVHDELCFSIADRKIGQEISDLMCNVVQLRIPMKVDLEYGNSWAGK